MISEVRRIKHKTGERGEKGKKRVGGERKPAVFLVTPPSARTLSGGLQKWREGRMELA
jgi:hypothetical protein